MNTMDTMSLAPSKKRRFSTGDAFLKDAHPPRNTSHGFMLTLPTELQLLIMKQIPNMWTLVSLRLVCRTFNDLYMAERTLLRKIQRDILVDAIGRWYHSNVRLRWDHEEDCFVHVRAETTPRGWSVPESTLETRVDKWNSTISKTGFTLEVMSFLPWFSQLALVAPDIAPLSWGHSEERAKCQSHERFLQDTHGINTRNHIIIAAHNVSGGHYVLDTMQARIYMDHSKRRDDYNGHRMEHHCYWWDLDKFVQLQIDYAHANPHLILDNIWLETDFLSDTGLEPTEEKALQSALESVDWPYRLDDPTMSYLQRWWRANGHDLLFASRLDQNGNEYMVRSQETFSRDEWEDVVWGAACFTTTVIQRHPTRLLTAA